MLDFSKSCRPIEPEEAQRQIARRIATSLNYMMQNLNKPLQVSVLSATAGISPSHFFYLFKRATGCTPLDYFIRARMRRACELLEGTSLNVKEVAAMLGYEDPFYFSRLFKSVNGIAPREYRSMKTSRRDGSPVEPRPSSNGASHERSTNGEQRANHTPFKSTVLGTRNGHRNSLRE
jgi:AraC-like DNA-binding protein